MDRDFGFSGNVVAKKISSKKPPIAWRVKNAIQPRYWGGFLANTAAKMLTRVTGIPTLTAELEVRVHRASGEWEDYGIVSYRVVTDLGVALLVDDGQAGTP